MTFLEILQNPLTNLPIEISSESNFRNTIRDVIGQFGKVIDESNDLSEPINGNEFRPESFKRRNKILRQGILNAIDVYYNGEPSRAFRLLSECLHTTNVSGFLNKDDQLDANYNFYRIRKFSGNYPLSKHNLFHIPFSQRGKIQTQRYSIPGFPSLYLSNSIFGAWEEMHRPGFENVQTVRISNTRTLKLLDLTTDIYNHNDHLIDNTYYDWKLLYKVMVWPLVAACSVKVKNYDDTFKPEYIIPQLLLQWINKQELDGIKYSSTHIDIRAQQHKGNFFNFVIPVRSSLQDSGYCSALTSSFESTQVLPMQLSQFLSLNNRLYSQETISTEVNSSIESIELIKGNPQPYATTYFGVLEHLLKGLKLESLS